MKHMFCLLGLALVVACGDHQDPVQDDPTEPTLDCVVGNACDDGDSCTHSDICNPQGVCVGTALVCESDADVCGVQRACNGTAQCSETYPAAEQSCDDSDACTQLDTCNGQGECGGEAYTCNENGICGGDDLCSCDVGYAGDYCERCDEGYILTRDGCIPKPTVPMVHVPAGSFLMGCVESDPNCDTEYLLQREVYLDGYYLDTYEVTAGDYKLCVDTGACEYTGPTGEFDDDWNWIRTYDNDRDDLPMNYVLWSQAREYCAWQGKRLPTEAEWEKAARGPDAFYYTWGNEPSANCNLAIIGNEDGDGCGTGLPWPGGSRPDDVSYYGVMDMVGNVSEIVLDRHDPNYFQEEPEGGWVNPQGPSEGTMVIFKGLSFESLPEHFGLLYKRGAMSIMMVTGTDNAGFRCARSEE